MKTFISKKDLWLGIWIWTFTAFGLGISILARSLVFTITMVVFVALMGWIWWGTVYYITETHLKIKCGPLYQKIPYSPIPSAMKLGVIVAWAVNFSR